MARRKTVKALYLTDPHCPGHSPKALRWACQRICDYKPDYLIVGGDVFEADAASRFNNEKDYDLLHEYQIAAGWLDAVADAGPGCALVWCLGNHDHNIKSKGRIDRRVRRAVDWNESKYGSAFGRWRQIPYDFSARGTFQLGQVLFWHGFDGAEDSNAIRINNACGGYGNRLVIGGHTHKPHGPTQITKSKTIPLPLWFANGGTLGPTRPDWTTRQDTSLWAPAVVKVELQMGRACQPGLNWDCDVEVMA